MVAAQEIVVVVVVVVVMAVVVVVVVVDRAADIVVLVGIVVDVDVDVVDVESGREDFVGRDIVRWIEEIVPCAKTLAIHWETIGCRRDKAA